MQSDESNGSRSMRRQREAAETSEDRTTDGQVLGLNRLGVNIVTISCSQYIIWTEAGFFLCCSQHNQTEENRVMTTGTT